MPATPPQVEPTSITLEPHDVAVLVRYINRDTDGDPHAAGELVGYLAGVLRQHDVKIPSDIRDQP